jgi:hypothetical protein
MSSGERGWRRRSSPAYSPQPQLKAPHLERKISGVSAASDELVRTQSRDRDQWTELAQDAVKALMCTEQHADGNKLVGRVSVLELKGHLGFYRDSLREAVRMLGALTQPRPQAPP